VAWTIALHEGETWSNPEQKVTAVDALRQRGHHPHPLRCIYISKSNGKKRLLGIPTMRNRAIQAEANPYDPKWEPYFERRTAVKVEATLHVRRQILRLWKEQDGLCPVCEQLITELTGWHNHHVVWKVEGGSDRDENRVLLHPNGHHQVHSQCLYVEKPRPTRGEREA